DFEGIAAEPATVRVGALRDQGRRRIERWFESFVFGSAEHVEQGIEFSGGPLAVAPERCVVACLVDATQGLPHVLVVAVSPEERRRGRQLLPDGPAHAVLDLECPFEFRLRWL